MVGCSKVTVVVLVHQEGGWHFKDGRPGERAGGRACWLGKPVVLEGPGMDAESISAMTCSENPESTRCSSTLEVPPVGRAGTGVRRGMQQL